MRLQLNQTPPARPTLAPCPDPAAPLAVSERARLDAYDNAVASWRTSFEMQLRQALPLLNGNRDPGPSPDQLITLLRALLQAAILFLDVAVPHNQGE